MPENKPTVLIFVEDPGAANLILGLREALERESFIAIVIATAFAEAYLSDREEKFLPLQSRLSSREIINKFAPCLVICGTSENKKSIGLMLIQESKIRGIPTVGLVDAPMNAEFRFRGHSTDPLTFKPDYIFVTSERGKKRFINLGVSDEEITVFLNPALINLEALGKKLNGKRGRDSERSKFFGPVAKSKKILYFLGEKSSGLNSTDFCRSDDYTLLGRGKSQERTKIVLEEVLDACKILDIRVSVFLRLHPKESPSDYAEYLNEVNLVDSSISTLESAFFADLVVGLSTTLLEEARRLGCNVLSVLPRQKELEWCPFPESKKSLIVTTRSELHDKLGQLLETQSPTYQNAYREKNSNPYLSELIIDLVKNQKKLRKLNNFSNAYDD